MKRYKNSNNPKPKQSFKWKLKEGITWEQVEQAKADGTFKFEDYFEKVEEEKK